MKLFADYHTHTKYSDGRGTPAQNIEAAAERGLSEVAITDHGPRGLGIGVAGPETFLQIREEVAGLATLLPDIRALVGAEAAVISSDGRLDLPKEIINQLDLLIAGLHPYYIPEKLGEALLYTLPNLAARFNRSAREKMRSTNTKALVETVHSYPVDIVSHPDLMLPVDVDELARACAGKETALEVNTGHNYNKEEIVRSAARWGARLAINSDAHYPETVGELASGLALVERLRFPSEMVINAVH
ncbi:PHP domain-containing protein [Pelotomaculum propionicicum]|uniref:PHP domain-containing protein n=1 Tax=Pelotomaculum propionicicum TaxID=258475 RepID=UPI003B7719CE